MTEQQADALMECIECWEDATKRFPHESSFSDMLAALTALCRHRDENLYHELYELARDKYYNTRWQHKIYTSLDNMQTWGDE